MKIRWTNASLRLRITPSELGRLRGGETAIEELAFPGDGQWRLVLQSGPGRTSLVARAGTVTLYLAAHDLGRLNDPSTEGVYFTAPQPQGLRYCIEKDFPCIHPRPAQANEPETETFDPPPSF